MRFILVAFLSMMMLPFVGKAQMKNPVSWQFSVKKLEGDNYRFEAKAVMESGFHIWAQDPGGDGSLIPTSFTAEELQSGWVGEWKEAKNPKVQNLEFIDGAVRWHDKEIVFYRDFKGKRGDKVKGAVQYQSCNDKMCYPPAIENFIVAVN